MIATNLSIAAPVAAVAVIMFTAGLIGGYMWRGDVEYHRRAARFRREMERIRRP